MDHQAYFYVTKEAELHGLLDQTLFPLAKRNIPGLFGINLAAASELSLSHLYYI